MKNTLILVTKILVSAILLYLIVLKIDWKQLTLSLRQGDLFRLSIGVILGLIFNMIKFLKWHILINADDSTNSYQDAAKSYMIGNALGLITPMRAGDLGRALYFHSEDRSRIIGLTIMDRFIDLIAVLILSVCGSFILISRGFGVLVVILGASSLFFLYGRGHLYKIFERVIPSGFLRKKMSKVIDVLASLEAWTITSAISFALLAFVFTILEFYYVVSAFESTTFASMFLTTPLITLSALIPVTFMGLGVREGLSIVLFSMLGISATSAVSAAFFCFLINNVSISIIGAMYLTRIEFKVRGITIGSPPVLVEPRDAKHPD